MVFRRDLVGIWRMRSARGPDETPLLVVATPESQHPVDLRALAASAAHLEGRGVPVVAVVDHPPGPAAQTLASQCSATVELLPCADSDSVFDAIEHLVRTPADLHELLGSISGWVLGVVLRVFDDDDVISWRPFVTDPPLGLEGYLQLRDVLRPIEGSVTGLACVLQVPPGVRQQTVAWIRDLLGAPRRVPQIWRQIEGGSGPVRVALMVRVEAGDTTSTPTWGTRRA